MFVFVNWAFTDSPAGVPTSATVDLVPPNSGVPNLIGTGAVLVSGSITSETRFGDYTSVSIDPTTLAGSCAVVADQYFGTAGQWKTRIARIGTCLPQAVVPNLHGDTRTEAAAPWPPRGLHLGLVSFVTDRTCNNIGLVLTQSPAAGYPGAPGQPGEHRDRPLTATALRMPLSHDHAGLDRPPRTVKADEKRPTGGSRRRDERHREADRSGRRGLHSGGVHRDRR